MTPPLRKRLERGAIYGLLLAVQALARVLPLRVLWALADAGALVLAGLARRRQRLADANIAAAFPEMPLVERRRVRLNSVRNVARTQLELLKTPYLSMARLRELMPLPDLALLREALASGTGVIVVTAHYGQWEWLAVRLADELGAVTSVARDHAHSGVAAIMNRARMSHGLRLLTRDDLLEMLRVMRAGEVLTITPDQHAAMGGVLVDFLGRPAWTFRGPAALVRASGARVFALFALRRGDGSFEVRLQPEIPMARTADREADLLENTRRLNAAIEHAIREAPDNWLWLHDRWKIHDTEAPGGAPTN